MAGWFAVGAAACLAVWLALGGERGEGAPEFDAKALLRHMPRVRRALEREGSARVTRACERQMPEFLDILGLGLSAGLSFDASLALFCDRRDCELSREIRAAMISWQMGMEGRSEALSSLSARLGSPSFEGFCSAATEALSFGAPLAQTLERQAVSIRQEQRSRVQERIEKVPVKMLVPLGTLVVPAMLLAILGPLLSAALAG
ncbi:type II secretion system F family protein [uncultured Parolsenella sp.]|uniref:type II secretion system F family protein n=1 Tax=uncultured Parolsenella sp. TaxID=2083008 RepID=UPI0025F4AC73|nr:type II secretion system F family protein [uncultured Parolsenella sp.]